jgi:D-alanine-D-alanine ligase
MHELLVPPDDIRGLSEKEVADFKSEYDVVTALTELGHEVTKLGLSDELTPLRKSIEKTRPHIVFNLLEEFQGRPVFDHAVVSYLELMGVKYTGNNPRGLVITRDKALTKKILHYHRIRTPRFTVFPQKRRIRIPKRLDFPLIVKSVSEEASAGIAQASVVTTAEALAERVGFIHERVRTGALAEEYIEGRELNVGVIGNQRLQVMPIWELNLDKLPDTAYPIATYKVKWDLDYQERHDIRIGPAKGLSEQQVREIHGICKRSFRVLELEGYARMDFRLRDDGKLFLLEANPNPDISRDEEFASAARAGGYEYEALIQKLVTLGLAREPGRLA